MTMSTVMEVAGPGWERSTVQRTLGLHLLRDLRLLRKRH